jgi:uncharacterized protein (TIGR00255 family)
MSLRSMTGFGRARTELTQAVLGGGAGAAGTGVAIVVEVRSVNLKGLEVKLRLPRSLLHEEPALIRRVKGSLERGRVDVTIDLQAERSAAAAVVDVARVAAVIAALQDIAAAHPQVSTSMTGGELLGVPGVFVRTGDDEHAIVVDDTLMAAVNAAVDEATRNLVRARDEEGTGLTLELRRRRDSIARLVDEVAGRTASAVADKQAKLRERLGVLLGEHLEPGRLVAELALMAERLDIPRNWLACACTSSSSTNCCRPRAAVAASISCARSSCARPIRSPANAPTPTPPIWSSSSRPRSSDCANKPKTSSRACRRRHHRSRRHRRRHHRRRHHRRHHRRRHRRCC